MEQLDPTLVPPDPDKAAKKSKQEAMSLRRTPRSEDIGRLLRRKRRDKDLRLHKCAEHIGTNRQRYAAIEAGKTKICFVELEELMTFLSIEPAEIWPVWGKNPPSKDQYKKLQVKAGNRVIIVVEGLESDP